MRSARGGANPSLDIELRSALGFEEGGLQIHQVHAVRPAARGPSGVPLRPDWERTALLPQATALYVMAAATACIQSWLTDDHQWIFTGLPLGIEAGDGHPIVGPAVSVRAHGEDRGRARYDSVSRTAIVRVGSLTWTVQDKAAADSMRDAWRYTADLGPIILGRQAPTRRRRA